MWILYTNVGYFLFALSSLVDRFLLLGPLPSSSLYALYVAMLGVLALFLAPLGFSLIAPQFLLLSLVCGALSIFALWALYEAIFRSEVSRVVPASGALQPIFVFLFSFLFFGKEALFSWEIGAAYLLFIVGGFLLAHEKGAQRNWGAKVFLLIVLATVLFALTFVLTKYIFIKTSFVNGLIWTRLGGLFVIPFLVKWGRAVQAMRQSNEAIRKLSWRIIFIVGSIQLVSALGGMLVLYAASIASVSHLPLINAMLGTEFIFLYLMAYVLHQKYPRLLQEKMEGGILYEKIFATSLILIGFVLLAVF